MATITGKTADAVQALDDSVQALDTSVQQVNDARIESAAVDAYGRLKLTRHDSTVIDAGFVGEPHGAVVMFAGTIVPSGWLLCDGRAISRTAYPDLYAAIGTIYGAGDLSTTFNLPNLEARLPRMQAASLGTTGGASTHTHTVASHTHAGPSHAHSLDGGSPQAAAHIGLSSGTPGSVFIERINTGSWNTNFKGDAPSCTTDVQGQTVGTKVEGNTVNGGTNATGGTSLTSDTGSSLPPYINLNFIIKA